MSQYDPHFPPQEPYRETNPYAPPDADLSPRFMPRPSAHHGDPLEPFSIDAVMRRSWYVFKDKLGICLGLVLGVGAVNNLLQIPGRLLLEVIGRQVGDQVTIGVLTFAFVAASMVLGLWLWVGQSMALLKLARGQRTEFAEAFRGGRFLVRMIVASLVMFLLFVVLALVCVLPAGLAFSVAGRTPVNVGHFVGFVLGLAGVVVAIGAGVRVFMYVYVIVDTDCGAIESLNQSLAVTRGHTFELIGLAIMGILINLLGLLMCLVGVIFTGSLTTLMSATAYAMLVGGGAGGYTAKPSSDLEFLEFDR